MATPVPAGLRHVPYHSSYASREHILEFASGRMRLENDPDWQVTGGATPADYALWARNGCGMACLQMVLGAVGAPVPPLVELGERCMRYGGYRWRADGHFEGLLYAPFVEFCRRELGLSATVAAPLTTPELTGWVRRGHAVLASVHKGIRQPELPPPSRGGHLVLVFAELAGALCFHNPSGHTTESQAAVWMSQDDFEPFFAGRGVVVALSGNAGQPDLSLEGSDS